MELEEIKKIARKKQKLATATTHELIGRLAEANGMVAKAFRDSPPERDRLIRGMSLGFLCMALIADRTGITPNELNKGIRSRLKDKF